MSKKKKYCLKNIILVSKILLYLKDISYVWKLVSAMKYKKKRS